MSLNHAPVLQELVTRISKLVCEAHGIDPDEGRDIPVGLTEDGEYVVETEENYIAFMQDVDFALAALFNNLSEEEIARYQVLFKEYEAAQQELAEKVYGGTVDEPSPDTTEEDADV